MALTTNLVSYWKLDEASGNAADSVGGNTLANQNTATYSAGKINNGVALASASSQYLSIADASQTGLDIATAWSISAWVKITSFANAEFCIAGKYLTTGNQRQYRMILESSGGGTALYVELDNSDDGTSSAGHFLEFDASQSDIDTTGVWYHIVGTVDVTSGAGVIYVNGTARTSSKVVGTTLGGIKNGTGAFAVGAFANPGGYFNGMIDEVGVWSRVLTSTEVTSLYNAGAGFAYPFATANTTKNFFSMQAVKRASYY